MVYKYQRVTKSIKESEVSMLFIVSLSIYMPCAGLCMADVCLFGHPIGLNLIIYGVFKGVSPG